MKRQIDKPYIGGALMAKKLVIVGFLILLVAAPAISVYGADSPLDESYCASPLKGNWSANTCTIPAGSSGEVPAGDSLWILTGTGIIVNGTLTVNGTLNLGGGNLGTNSGGIITNNGVIEHRTSGEVNNYGAFNNNGSLLVAYGATLVNYNAFTTANSLIVYGELDNYSSFTNTGTVNLSKSAGDPIGGIFFASVNTSTTNQGTLTISAGSTMSVRGSLTNHGTLTNKGTFRAKNLTNSSTGTLYNDLNADWKCFETTNPSIINEGSFTNRYYLTLVDECIFTNKSTGTFSNTGITYVGQKKAEYPWDTRLGGSLVNEGSVSNTGSIILANNNWSEVLNANGAVISNSDAYSVLEVGVGSKVFNTGVIEHKQGVIRSGDLSFPNYTTGYIYNYSKTDGTDYGALNKYCAGTITFDYAYIDPDPVDMCTGTIVIIKNTESHFSDDFSFTGSGSLGTFSLDDDYESTLPNTRTFSGLTLGSYTVTEAEASGFTLTGLVCTSTEGTSDTTTWNLSTRTATIDLDGGETVACTFTNSIASCTPPAVTSHPVNQVITYGSKASFNVNGTNYTSVQWQVNSGSGWSNIAGATSATYTLTKPAVSLSGYQYRAVLTGGCAPAATSNAATLTVNKATPTISWANPANITYPTALSGVQLNATASVPGSFAYTPAAGTVLNAGNGQTLDVDFTPTDTANYNNASKDVTINVLPKGLTASITAANKEYDGTTGATLTGCTLNGVVSGDFVTCDDSSASASFDDKNVGTNKMVSATGLALSGADAGNYSFAGTASGTASITAKHITGSFSADDKEYDGTTAATVLSRGLSGALSGDSVTLAGGSATFNDEIVGTDKTVTLTSASLSGTGSGNYVLDSVATTTADITAKGLTASITASDKEYDGMTGAAVTDCTLNGVVSGDVVTCNDASASASFADKNVGTGKTVSATGLALSGAAAGNYSFAGTGSGTASITAKHITGSFTADDKIYDGTTAASVLSGKLSGALSGDDVILAGGTATFNDENVGTGKTVTLTSASLSGTDAGNYVLDSVATTTADITVRPITVTPDSGQSKVYGNADPKLTYTVGGDGLATGDSFTGALSRAAGEDAGFYEITQGTLAIDDGNGGNNYDLTFSTGVDFKITKTTSTVAVTCLESVVYDGTAQSPCTAEATGAGMSPVDVTASLVYAKNTDVGTATAGASWDGDANHTGNTASDSFEITPAPVTAAAGSYNGTYNGEAHSPSECAVTGAYKGDLSCANDPASVGPDVGSGTIYPVVKGTGLTNYAITKVNGSWSITPAEVTPILVGYTGTYDGEEHSNECVMTGAYTGDLRCTPKPAVVGPDIGFGFVKSDGVVSGTERSNFVIQKPVDSTWQITQAPVTVTAGSYNDMYDGAAHSPSTCAVTGDYTGDLRCTNSPASVGPDVGSGTVTVGDVSGTGLSNFSITKADGYWEITPATLTVTANDQTAQYSDASPDPLTFQYAGLAAGENATGIDKAPICSTTRLISSPAGDYRITCSGGDDNNYTFSYKEGTFTVTKENATGTFDNANPVALQVSTPGGDLAANALTLIVKVEEKEPDLPAATAAAGDINNAGLTVQLEPLAGGGAIPLDCTASVAESAYAVKTFTCKNPGTLAVGTYDVVATVTGDYYTGEGYDGFTVFDPSLGFATGGGWFYWPGTTEKTNFGFTMKYNKKATNVQGNLLVVRHHADGTISRLKSNALDGLALKDSKGCGIATFSGKATYMTWDPSANEGLGDYVNTGGNPFSVYAEDCNEPGTGVDSFWVRSVDQLLMAKTAPSNAVPIGGGNIAVPHTAK
jgi:hypothetical protein